MKVQPHIVMVASENDALIGGKVGGVGDVIRSLPNALATLGCTVTVIIPSYGFLHKDNPSKLLKRISFPFGGKQYEGEFYVVQPKQEHANVRHLLLEHPELRGDPLYYNDPSDSPFLRDAAKYALFCSAVGKYLTTIQEPFVLHLHDWHCGFLFLLRELHPEFSSLKSIQTVFTIHNLAIQGTRPVQKHASSVESWFPELFRNKEWVQDWKDPRYAEACFTPMAAGIQYANKVNTVSPTYADEILKANNIKNGDHGGEGLEQLLCTAKKENRLFGILNGCDYPEGRTIPKQSFPELCRLMLREVEELKVKHPAYDTSEVVKRIERLANNPPGFLLASVARIVAQKLGLLFERCSNGNLAVDEILNTVSQNNGIYIVLGNGDAKLEQQLDELAKRCERLIIIRGYSERLSEALYANGSLFVMPSLFEPCGISQMLAMRDSQPCLVNSVGGLRDTVMNGVNGFAFYGTSQRERADNFVAAAQRATDIFHHHKLLWEKITIEAGKARFTWGESARRYFGLMYS